MIDQIAIAVLGVAAVFLSQSRNEHWRRYACIVGLASEPFWFYAAWHSEQWGIFVLSIFYTLGWCEGVRTYWLNRSAPS